MRKSFHDCALKSRLLCPDSSTLPNREFDTLQCHFVSKYLLIIILNSYFHTGKVLYSLFEKFVFLLIENNKILDFWSVRIYSTVWWKISFHLYAFSSLENLESIIFFSKMLLFLLLFLLDVLKWYDLLFGKTSCIWFCSTNLSDEIKGEREKGDPLSL